MTTQALDTQFAGSIPRLYEALLVPLIFRPYADDLARRAAARRPRRVLEVAAGTGVATRALAAALDADATLVATDLNPPMLETARALGASRPLDWQIADAQALPFDDGAFDLVACQFGAMFFPDRPGAYAEMRRVLAPGGTLLFSVWDRIETNDFARVVTDAMAELWPADPPRFLARTPHGYHEPARIEADVRAGGFGGAVSIEAVDARSRAPTAAEVSSAYCEGTPLRNEIEARGTPELAEATAVGTRAIAGVFGHGPVDGAIRALVVTAER